MGYSLSDVANNEAKKFALYTIESRAIPNLIDGLKPVNRFYLYSSIKNSSKEYRKVSAVSGVVSDYGYNHGEASAAGAGQLMAADWNNNICLIDGRGSFGTRLIPEAGAPRYVYTKLHKNFSKYIKDINLSPVHEDPEHEPPAFYIPVIPLVLANGTKGIATGFSTNILPRSEDSIIKACKEYLDKGTISKRLPVKFPQFKGKTKYDSVADRHISTGILKKKSMTLWTIEEIPYGIPREEYIKHLDKLEDNDKIVSYEDMCSKDGFKFEIKFKNNIGKTLTEASAIKLLKLEKTYAENLNVIGPDGKLKEYDDERDLIKDFIEYRKTILQDRIQNKLEVISEDYRFATIKAKFIGSVLGDKIVFKNKKKAEVISQIKSLKITQEEDDCERLLKMNIMSLTSEMVKELRNKLQDLEQEKSLWSKETSENQFQLDIKDLIEA